MKIALFSPLNPVKTGISDYTEEMLFPLNKYMDIDLYIDESYLPVNKEIQSHFAIMPFRINEFNPSKYDEIVYHMGNYYAGHKYIYEALKRFSGIVVLHDCVLQGFYAERFSETKNFEEYRQLLRKYYFQKGEEIARHTAQKIPSPIWESDEAFEYPLNEEIIEHARALIVHSNFVRNRIKKVTSKPVAKINHHGHFIKTFDTDKIRKELGCENEDILICSTGFVNKNKRYDIILSSIAELDRYKIKYVIAGLDRGNILDNVWNENLKNVIVLGHLPIRDLEGLICASDICINLRYPTMGESSSSLLRKMGYGKPTLVSNFGSYAELPDYCVLKIYPDIDEKEIIKRYITALISDKDFRLSIGREAKDYIQKECSIEKCAAEYAAFIKNKKE